MKKLFMVLCVVIMFFGIVGCPSSDDPTGSTFTPDAIAKPAADTDLTPIDGDPGNDPNNAGAVPEPATLILLGSGLVGLAGIGRKKFFKKD